MEGGSFFVEGDKRQDCAGSPGEYRFHFSDNRNGVKRDSEHGELASIMASGALLPIGSIVTISDADEKYVIVSHNVDGFDYILRRYVSSSNQSAQVLGTMKNQIVRIYSIGNVKNSGIGDQAVQTVERR